MFTYERKDGNLFKEKRENRVTTEKDQNALEINVQRASTNLNKGNQS